MATDPEDQEWYSIAEQASKEMDLAKLARLVSQLCGALDKRVRDHSLEPLTDAESSSPTRAYPFA
jgi:hypothetical protein